MPGSIQLPKLNKKLRICCGRLEHLLNLSPCDYHLFGLQEALEDRDLMMMKCSGAINWLQPSLFYDRNKKLPICWSVCPKNVSKFGDYIENFARLYF